MNNLHLRAILLKLQDRLSDDDRKRLHFFLGNNVPRRIRDDPSLGGTLCLLESLFDQDKINEDDFSFLINALDEIQCIDAVRLLREHKRRMQSNEINESVQSLSLVMPPLTNMVLVDEDEDEDENDKYSIHNSLIDQTNILSNGNTITTSKNVNNNPVPIIINNERESFLLSEQKQPSSLSSMTQKCLLLFVLLSIILVGAITGCFIWIYHLKIKCNNRPNELRQTTDDKPTSIIPLRAPAINIHSNAKWMQNGITVAGGNGAGNGINQLHWPLGLFVDDDNETIYIADRNNHRIVAWKYGATSGQVVIEINNTKLLWRPYDVIVDKKRDSLIICNGWNEGVMRWSRRDGTSKDINTLAIDARGVTMDEDGSVYVSDYKSYAVRRYRIDDNEGTIVAGGKEQGSRFDQLDGPYSVFVDRDHSVYVSDAGNHRVMKWEEGAKKGSVVAGGHGGGESLKQLRTPKGIAVDQLGTVYVADWGNHRIMRWPKKATQGSIVVGGHGEGNQTNQFMWPYGLSFDRQGNLYVADQGNNRVQKFNIEQTINE